MKFAYVLAGDPHVAEDLVQEAFVKVYARSRRAEAPEVFAGYLTRTVLNEWRSRRRRERLWNAFARTAVTPDTTSFPDIDASADVWAAIRRLPPRQRAAIFLRYYEDMSVAGLAAQLECSEAAARSLLTHATKTLRRRIEKGAS